jgi:hypothetical protein
LWEIDQDRSKDDKSGLPVLSINNYIFKSYFMGEILKLDTYRESEGSGVLPRKFSRYIKGPLPLSWIVEASKLSQASIRVGLLLWYRYGITNDPRVRLSSKRLAEFDLPRRTCTRGLERLELAGLVVVDRQHSRAPVARLVS